MGEQDHAKVVQTETATEADADADAGWPGLSPSLTSFLDHLLRAAHAASMACAASSLPPDRHPSDIAVLTGVQALGPASQRLLAERLAINRTTMVQIVDRLEEEGLLVRGRDPHDRRSYAVTLTALGRRTLARLERQAADHTACMTRNLSAAQRRRLNLLLHQVLATPLGGLIEMPPKLAERTGFLVARAHFALRSLGIGRVASLSIEPQHFAVLVILDDLGPSPQQRVAGELGVSGPVVVPLADHLEDQGLVERRRAPEDRRVHLLTMTERGAEALRDARRVVADETARFTEPIGPDGAAELQHLLSLLLGAPSPPT